VIELLVYHQALIRELINGAAFVLFLTLTVMITVYLWDTWIDEGPLPLEKWNQVPGVPVSCFMWWVFAAEAYRTANVWMSYVQGKTPSADLTQSITGVGIFSASSVNSTIGYLLAGVVLCGWLLRGIYLFTPPVWKRRAWRYAAAGAIAFDAAPTLFNYGRAFYEGVLAYY
jgi:hypothetical protein